MSCSALIFITSGSTIQALKFGWPHPGGCLEYLYKEERR